MPLSSCDKVLPEPEATAQTSSANRVIEGLYFVEFVDDGNLETEDQIAELTYEIGGTSILFTGPKITCALKAAEMRVAPDQAELFESDPRVVTIEQVVEFQMPDLGVGTPDTSLTQVLGWGADSIGVVPGTRSGTHKRVWVIDSGVDVNHPDLTVDATLSKSFVADTTSYSDDFGHGTAVASIIAAKDNATGMIGVAPGASIISLRIAGVNGKGTPGRFAAAMDYLCKNGKPGDVVNISYEVVKLPNPNISETSIDRLVKKIADSGIIVVCAAGNDGGNANLISPARVEHANVFTVSSYKRWGGTNNSIPNFKQGISNYGNPPIEYSEPGGAVPHLEMMSQDGGVSSSVSGGTSIAAPHLAGIILMNGKNGVVVTDSINGDLGPGIPRPNR